jgi:hypothetical protein
MVLSAVRRLASELPIQRELEDPWPIQLAN